MREYTMAMEIQDDLVLWCTITVIVVDPGKTEYGAEKRGALFFQWKSEAGDAFIFERILITWPNLSVLTQGDILERFATLTLDTPPHVVAQRLETLGFVRKRYWRQKAQDVTVVASLAKKYGMTALVNTEERVSVITYRYGDQTYPDNRWAAPPSPQQREDYLKAIVGEAKRRQFATRIPAGDLTRDEVASKPFTVYALDLISRTKARRDDAQDELVELMVTQIKRAYNNSSNMLLLQRVREDLADTVNSVLATTPQPLEALHCLRDIGDEAIREAPLNIYSVLQPWKHSVSLLHPSLVLELMLCYDDV